MSSIAMQTVPAAHGGVVLGILPLATSIFAASSAANGPRSLFWICGVAGAALVVLFAMRDGGMQLSPGDIWLFLAALSASLGYVVSGKLARKMPGWEVICWALIVTAPVSVIGAFMTYGGGSHTRPRAEIAAFLYLGFGSMFLGFFAWNVGLAMGGIARVSQVQLLQQLRDDRHFRDDPRRTHHRRNAAVCARRHGRRYDRPLGADFVHETVGQEKSRSKPAFFLGERRLTEPERLGQAGSGQAQPARSPSVQPEPARSAARFGSWCCRQCRCMPPRRIEPGPKRKRE